MSFIQGFQVRERLYESKYSIVLRAIRDHDELPVVIKILKSDYPSAAELARYRWEFEIVQGLELTGVIRSYELRRHDKTLLILFEDFGAMSLADLLRDRPLSLDEFIETAIQVTTALGHLHSAHIIHKDINPSNLVINPSTGEVKIIDFGISTRSSKERPVTKAPEVLEGTLPYMSPEQTGRMNRSLDYRTDFYSLGATFYELLTRSQPFDADDQMQLVHYQIAREPIPAHRRNPDVPLALSKIVSKLMAKRAEDRYQSAAGLLADLETVRAGGGLERFEAGRADFSDRFQIPERLYGRENEVERLLEAFESARRGRAEIMLVAGYSGVGKSALVQEIHKPITRNRGYFISGKFDQLQRNVPYLGLVAAFRDLVRQLLTESSERLATWRRDLNEALAPNGRVILDALPDLELIIGPQPPVTELAAAEATNRFHRAFGQLLRALCTRDSVVLFLDDLQWVDSATLGLFRVILTDGGLSRLFLIGAYRDNEITAVHPLMLALRDIKESGGQATTLTLPPLGLADVAKLLGDTLQADAGQVSALARLVVQKTQGNPLFVRQFLSVLHHEGLIKPSLPSSQGRTRWSWDLQAIRSAEITDNVVNLLLTKLRRLPTATQEVLRLAACIGNRFDVDTLALIQKSAPEETFESLRPAVETEILRPLSELTTSDAEDALSPLLVQEFGFQHDRIQQAAYGLIQEDQKQYVHLAIGRRLQTTLPPTSLKERLFEIVDHLNIGRDLIDLAAERTSLAELNLEAARKASDATAYSAALSYVDIAQALLGDDGWDTNYDLTIDAFRQRAALEYLNRNFDQCTKIVEVTLQHARTNLEKAEVHFTRIAQHTLLTEFAEALTAGRNALALLGIELKLDNPLEPGQLAMGTVARMLEGREVASLFENPDCDNQEMSLAQRCLRHLAIAAFLSNQNLFPLIVGTSVGISLKHGNAPESALSFANYGLMLGAFMGRYKEGLEFGDLALRLCDRFGGSAPTATVCLVLGTELMPWVHHVRHAVPIIDRGYREGLDSGDILWAGYLLMYRVFLDSFGGKALGDLLDGMPALLEFTSRTQNPGAAAGILAYQIVLSTLAGRTKSSSDFSADGVDEAAFLESCERHQVAMAICFYKILKAQALYLFGRPKLALEATREIDGMLGFIVNHPNLADHLLYQSLSLTALWNDLGANEGPAAMEQLQANLSQLKIWSNSCPDNFMAKRLMVEAEIARISNDAAAAAEFYDRAIDAAHKAQLAQDEALANELAARFSMERRPTSRVGAMYLRDARYAYQLWGAYRKVEELEFEFPQLLTEYRDMQGASFKSPANLPIETIQSSTARSSSAFLDLNTLIKAAQTISGEVVLGQLLERLIGILIENAGAQRGLLLLSRDGELFVQAEGSVASDEIAVLMSIPIDSPDGSSLVPAGVVHFAARTREAVVVDDAQQDERFMTDPYVQKQQTRSLLCQPILNQGQLIGLVYLENDLVTGAFTPERKQLLALLSGQIAVSIKNAELVEHLEDKVRERTAELELRSQFIEQTFGRYMSNEIAESLLKSPEALDFSGHKKTVTILMSDLRGFTAFSETLSPETIVRMLNNYLSEMTTIIQKYNGTIDSFIGDAIQAFFGAPLQRPDDAERAVACALEMQMAMPRVNAWNVQQNFPDIEMGIGINTGEVVVGNIGSRKRAKYSVQGSNANLASRIEGHTVGGQILIAGATRDAVKAPLTIVSAMTIEPKGVTRPITIYDVGGLGGPYDLALPQRDVQWTDFRPALPLTFRLLTEKEVVGDEHDGLLIRLSAQKAEIQSRMLPSKFTDLKLLLKPSDLTAGIYGKVIELSSAEGRFVLHFTTMPPEARKYFSGLGARTNT
ncbi:AAA family ATPase [Bradyrhizobium japonicum]|uniref:AAA family ATPase n=1 Tax=Bradyrhizobium japonicum TaxID=375 RepID=UPI001BABD5D6|nr:AAA family ATPase [Bradyrhizobium japonicum]MBR0733194.1 AAA family ATPase [Bradyrhizobium japonicum]